MPAVSLKDFFMGRDVQYAKELTEEVTQNAEDLLSRVNALLADLGIEAIKVSSGWRPASVNAKVGGAKRSAHVIGKAIDLIDDKAQSLAKAIQAAPEILQEHGLWMEHPSKTIGKNTNWVHLDTMDRKDRPVRIFMP